MYAFLALLLIVALIGDVVCLLAALEASMRPNGGLVVYADLLQLGTFLVMTTVCAAGLAIANAVERNMKRLDALLVAFGNTSGRTVAVPDPAAQPAGELIGPQAPLPRSEPRLMPR